MRPSLRQRRGGASDAHASDHARRTNGIASAPDPRIPPTDSAEREHLLSVHIQRTKAEQRALLGEDTPIWRCRCSWSVLGALVIWLMIGLAVWAVVLRPGSSLRADGTRQSQAAGAAVAESGGEGAAPRGWEQAGELPDGCRGDHCLMDGGSEAFGTILGAHNGVFGFSNCRADTCISMLENAIDVLLPAGSPLAGSPAARSDTPCPASGGCKVPHRLVAGMKWQCVEYARRYWMLQGRPVPALFGSVEGAADIWDELQVATLFDGSTTPLLKYGNGLAPGMGGSRPRVGDLLIYPRDVGENGRPVHFPYGHVAVIVGVDEAAGVVFVAEQNWSSQPWPGPYHNYSRQLQLTVAENGARTIHDPYHSVQGWVRYAKYSD